MRQVVFNVTYLGYTGGELTNERDGYRYGIKLSSGLIIYMYHDEFY